MSVGIKFLIISAIIVLRCPGKTGYVSISRTGLEDKGSAFNAPRAGFEDGPVKFLHRQEGLKIS